MDHLTFQQRNFRPENKWISWACSVAAKQSPADQPQTTAAVTSRLTVDQVDERGPPTSPAQLLAFLLQFLLLYASCLLLLFFCSSVILF